MIIKKSSKKSYNNFYSMVFLSDMLLCGGNNSNEIKIWK